MTVKNKKETIHIETFGCRLNIYESELIRQHAEKAGLKDAIIINSCAVTSEAERQGRQAIRKLHKENPNAKLIITGCAAQINSQQYAAMDEVNYVIGNDEKLKLETFQKLANNEEAPILVNDIMSIQETAHQLLKGFEGRARAFIQVQNGCDHRCTFCTIPFGRGNSRSVPIGEIVTQTRLLCQQGFNEIVITGVDVTSYGMDLPGQPSFGQMLKRLLALVPEIKRLRLSSLDAVEIDEDLWRLISDEERLMPHLHLSIQSGDNMILKRMKRRHSREDILHFCEQARKYRPDIVFGADIIAGFPTETEEMFEESKKIITEADLTWLHIFPYSEREGTPAANMPQLPKTLRKERAKILREIGDAQINKFLNKQIGCERSIILEQNNLGRTEHFAPVKLPAEFAKQYQIGDLIKLKIKGYDPHKKQLFA